MRILVIVLSLFFLVRCTGSLILPYSTMPMEDMPPERHPSSTFVLDKSGYRYEPSDRSCDGFPRLQVGPIATISTPYRQSGNSASQLP